MQKPLIAAFRPLTTRLLNPLTRRFVGRLPGFAIISYVGRTSGRTYRTLMSVFHRDGDYRFALTYGPVVRWVKNVIASGGFELEERGRTVRLGDPRRFSDPKASLMPLPVRFFLRLIQVTEFLRISPGDPTSDRTPDKVRGGSRRSRLDAVPVKESAETDTSATRQRHLSRRLHRLP